MFWFSQVHFEATGWLGLIVGSILLAATLSAAIYGLWNWPGKWLWGRHTDRQTIKRQIELNKFKIQWILEHNTKPIFIMDDQKRCIWVNDALTDLLNVDSSDVEGRAWHKLVKESHLTRVLAKWKESYEHQSPYVNATILIVNGQEKHLLISAEPFIWKGKVRNYLGKLEEM